MTQHSHRSTVGMRGKRSKDPENLPFSDPKECIVFEKMSLFGAKRQGNISQPYTTVRQSPKTQVLHGLAVAKAFKASMMSSMSSFFIVLDTDPQIDLQPHR